MAQEIYHRSEWGNPNEQWGNVYLNADLTNELYKRASEYENSWVTDQLLNGVGIKPSIILTPTAYEDGILNSVKPAKTFGSELIPNGTFKENVNGWTTNNANATFVWQSDQTALFTSTSYAYAKITPSLNLTSGTYKVSFDILSFTGTLSNVHIGLGTSGNTVSTIGSFSYNYVSSGGSTEFQIRPNSGGTGSIKIDNISVKKITDADFDFTRGSSATRVNEQGLVEDVQILSGELVQNGNFEQVGSELVTNGTFDDGLNGWNNNASLPVDYFSVVDNKLEIENISGSLQVFTSDSFNVSANKIYKISLDTIKESGVDDFDITLRNSPLSTVIETITSTHQTGELIHYFKSTSTQSLVFQFTIRDTIKGSIDNVSVKEVGQNWTFGSSWSMGDGKAIYDDSAINSLNQNLNFSSGKSYKIQFQVNGSSGTGARIKFGTYNDSVVFFDYAYYTDGLQTLYYNATSNTTNFNIKGHTSGSSFNITNISLIEITDDTDLPRINYTNFDYENGEVVPYSGEGSLLLENQSTNLITYSEDFSHSYWDKIEISVVDDFIISPDGTQNASKITINNNTPFLGNTNISLTTGNVYTISCFVKKGTNRWVRLSSVSSVSLGAWFDLENNVVGTVNSTSASIENYGNGWYRISNTITAISGSNQTFLGLSDADGGTSSTQVGNTVFAWGFQVEALSYATSYIPTEGSIKTRLADVCNNSGSSDLINSTEGVLYAEIAALADDGTFRIISLDSGDNTNIVKLGYRTTSNAIYYEVRSGDVSQAFQIYTTTDVKQFHKVAVLYQQNNFKLFINGVNVLSDTSGITPVGLNNISFEVNSSARFEGKVKCLAVFKEALSDTELEKLTQV